MRTSLNRDPSPEDGAAAPLATLDALPDGGVTALEARVGGEDESLIVHRQGNAVRAWLNVCPHAGRRLDWAPGEFLRAKNGDLVCAVHGATFELGEGNCVAGPCRGDRLRAVALQVRDGRVFLEADIQEAGQ